MFPFHVAPSKIQRHTGKGGSHFETAETFGCGGCLANIEDAAAHSATSPGRMYEESPYLCRVVTRIQQSILAPCAVVASKKRLPLAPTSATGYDLVVINHGFGYKIGSILDQSSIHAEDVLQG